MFAILFRNKNDTVWLFGPSWDPESYSEGPSPWGVSIAVRIRGYVQGNAHVNVCIRKYEQAFQITVTVCATVVAVIIPY